MRPHVACTCGQLGEEAITQGTLVLSWQCQRHVGDMSATRDIVGECRRHGVSLPTTCQQGAIVTSLEHVGAPFYFIYPT